MNGEIDLAVKLFVCIRDPIKFLTTKAYYSGQRSLAENLA
jgi:hypothetical protein